MTNDQDSMTTAPTPEAPVPAGQNGATGSGGRPVTMRAELRPRGEGPERHWVGVFWPVDALGQPVGDKQVEIDFGGPGVLGPRVAFSLYVKELAKQPGWSLAQASEGTRP